MVKIKKYFPLDKIKRKSPKLKLQVEALRKLSPEILAKAIQSKLQQNEEK